MKKAAVLVMIMTLISKTLGFGRDVILSYFYGASYISDAYLISQTIPNVLFGFIGTGVLLYGTLIATVFQLIVMFPSARKLGFRYQ